MTTPAEVDALAEQLENNSWRPDSRGGLDCVDQAGAMAAQHLREYAALLRAREAGLTDAWNAYFNSLSVPIQKNIECLDDLCKSLTHKAFIAGYAAVLPLPADWQPVYQWRMRDNDWWFDQSEEDHAEFKHSDSYAQRVLYTAPLATSADAQALARVRGVMAAMDRALNDIRKPIGWQKWAEGWIESWRDSLERALGYKP